MSYGTWPVPPSSSLLQPERGMCSSLPWDSSLERPLGHGRPEHTRDDNIAASLLLFVSLALFQPGSCVLSPSQQLWTHRRCNGPSCVGPYFWWLACYTLWHPLHIENLHQRLVAGSSCSTKMKPSFWFKKSQSRVFWNSYEHLEAMQNALKSVSSKMWNILYRNLRLIWPILIPVLI